MRESKIIIILLLFISTYVLGQTSKADLEKQRKKTEEQINLTNKYLKETKSKKQMSLRELNSLSRLIENREELINNLNEEIQYVNSDVETKREELDSINLSINKEKENYAKSIVQSYKNRKVYNNALYIFASKSINQLVQRLRFVKYLSVAQEVFLRKIEEKKNQLTRVLNELQGLKESKETLANQKESEKTVLEKDKEEKNKTLTSLIGKEAELKVQLNKQKKAKEDLNRQINALIAKEIAEANKKAKAEAEKNKKTTTTAKTDSKTDSKSKTKTETKTAEPTLTPEAKLISDNFASNKGSLPWPVEKGFISEKFGTHVHDKLDQITVQNNGIDIQTNKSASARCVFKGTVAAIIEIPGMGTTILVSHGDYFTVYSKLKSTNVKQGDVLTSKQIIGTVGEEEDGISELHFEIWKNQEKQNPESWITKK